MRTFDMEEIRLITAFENITKTEVRDCINGDTIYFLINPGNMGKAIGKNGQMIKSVERLMNKPIKIFEWSEQNEEFVKNMIPSAQKIELNTEKAVVSIASKDRGAVIGKSGSNIAVIRTFLERNSSLKELKIL